MNESFNEIESIFRTVDIKLTLIKSSYSLRIDTLKDTVEKFFQDEEKIRNEIIESCLELRNRLKNSLETSLKPENLDLNEKLVEFNCGKHQSFLSFVTSLLHHKNPFSLIGKIKHVNLLRVFEYKEENFGLADLNEPYYDDYDIFNAVLISLNRVFLYLKCTDIEKPDLMVIRHVKVGNIIESGFDASNSNPVICTRESAKLNIFGPNMILFEDKIVILYRTAKTTYTLEFLSSKTLETIKKTCIENNTIGEFSHPFLLSNYDEIIVHFQNVHQIYDSNLNLTASLGQNTEINQPFYNEDTELLYISADMIFYRGNIWEIFGDRRVQIKILSRSSGEIIHFFYLSFVREFNWLDSILVDEKEHRFVYKSFTTNNLISFDFDGGSIHYSKITSSELNKKSLLLNYRTYFRDRKYKELEKSYLFYQYNSKFILKRILLI